METWKAIAEVQPLAARILTNSLKRGRMSHAYLIRGERGTGKESIARLLAKSLFCENITEVEPCHTCRACRRIESHNHPDVHWIEPDGQSIKTAQIEHLQKEFTYSSMESEQKVYIIKAADTLTANAGNRILKFLEEPNRKTTAIMLTENSQAILPTIRSRCQMLDLKPLHPKALQKQLRESGISERRAILLSALTNNVDDAIAMHDDPSFAESQTLVIQLMELFINQSSDVHLFIHKRWMPHFKERNEQEQGLDILLLAFKDLLYYHIDLLAFLVVFDPDDERLEKGRITFSKQKIIAVLHAIVEAKQKLRQHVQPALVMEQLVHHIQR